MSDGKYRVNKSGVPDLEDVDIELEPEYMSIVRDLQREDDRYNEDSRIRDLLTTIKRAGEDEVALDELYEDVDVADEYVPVDDDWEDVLDNHTDAEGYDR